MYQAIVARIFTRPLPGSDHIVIGTCRGYQVIVNKSTVDGQLGVFFEAGGQLSEEFANVNDLIRRKNQDGTPAGGFFENNRRVNALKLRGAKSEGFWCPLEHLSFTGARLEDLKEGDVFEVLNGHEICHKYFTPATLRAQAGRSKCRMPLDIPMFPKHVETDAFRKSIAHIPIGAVLHISKKLHGTSFRYGHVLDVRLLAGWRRLWAWIRRVPAIEHIWAHINGSRNVVLKKRVGDGFYGAEKFRFMATDRIVLRRGEVIYGELVGYTETGQPIMAAHSTAGLKDKSITKQYGDRMVYAYGCQPGEFCMYVYRIVQHGPDGNAVELPWHSVVSRCRELGLTPVPHVETMIYDGNQDTLRQRIDMLVNGDGKDPVASILDATHIEEGVVIRYESEHGTGWLKEKQVIFGILEGYLKESDDFVDAEEVA